MKAMYVNEGHLIEYVAPKKIARGDIVTLGDRCGIAYNDAESGELVPVYVKGRFTVPAATGTAILAGDELYYSESTGTVSKTDDGGVYIGFAASGMDADGTKVDVILA